MRKILVLMMVFMLSLMVTKAQNQTAQAPIIALVANKLYAVSPVDGQARLLVEPDLATDTISQLRDGSLSPDGKQLVYVEESAFDTSVDQYKSRLFVVNIADGKIENITPKGGIFDVPVAKGQVFQITVPTWSYDGQRIYYFRDQYAVSKNYTVTLQQLAYYDVATQKHDLIARIDPRFFIENLQAVRGGMVTRWYKPGFDSPTTSTLYALDNRIIKQVDITAIYFNTLHESDDYYYARLKNFGNIEALVNIVNDEEKPSPKAYYPAAQSLMAGQNSMHVFNTQSDTSIYHVYGADRKTSITKIVNDYGFLYGIAPDGQSMAYLQFEDGTPSTINILDMTGNVRKLDFRAEQIIWGALEYVPFLARG